MSKPAVGSKAPVFTASVVGGEFAGKETVSLAKLKGQWVVLYFYPKNHTPGCTKQACGLRDDWGKIHQRAQVFGISTDVVKSHAKFIKKHRLPFPLIADEDLAVVNAYGVWVEKSMYGKTYFGTERSTFVIDPAGKIAAILEKVKPDEHLNQVLEVLDRHTPKA